MQRQSWSDRLVLVAEDEALIGLMVAEDLAEAGLNVAGPFAQSSQALAWLDTATPDLALVDIMLRDGLCLDLVRGLRQRGVPFVVFSAHAHSDDLPPEFQDAPWLDKPVSFETLLAACTGLERSAQPRSWPGAPGESAPTSPLRGS